MNTLGMAQSGITSIDLFNVDITRFPEITVQGRVINENRDPVEALSTANLTLQEDGKPLDFELHSFPISTQLVIVIDGDNYTTSQGATGETRSQETQAIALRLVDSLADGDTAMLLLRQESKTALLQDSIGDKDKLRQAVSNMKLVNLSKLPRGLDAVRSALDAIKTTTGPKKLSTLVFVSPGVFEKTPGSDFSDIINYANTLAVPINTILVRSSYNDVYFRTAFQGLQDLAQKTGGLFNHYTNVAVVDELMAGINKKRISYTFTFRSTSKSNSERTLELLPNPQAPNLIRGRIKYTVKVEAPTVNILKPEPGKEITRTASTWDQPSAEIEPGSVDVGAEVVWSQYPRRITLAEFQVENSPFGAPLPNPPGTTFNFPWDLRSYDTSGGKTFQIRVRVVDELGMESLSAPINVSVATVRPSQPPPPPSSCSDLSGAAKIGCYVREFAGVIAMVLAGIALVLVIVFGMRNRDKLVEAGGEIAGAMNQAWVRLTQGKKKPVAFLAVLSEYHRGLLGESVPIFPGVEMTTIGRNLRTNTIHIPDTRDNTPISREHCAIIQQDGKWAIKDYNSTHGTFVEKVRIEPANEFPLHDGDEIWVGTPAYGGARFLFRMAALDGTLPEANNQDRETH
jgi:hypothetical protein